MVAKLTPAGDALLYSTYIGGQGPGYAGALGITADAAGNAYIGGQTDAADFPVTKGAFQTSSTPGSLGFLCKLDRSGTLAYSTLLVGSASFIGSVTRVVGIAVDATGNLYAAGFSTDGGSPPTTAGALQLGSGGFLVKLNPAGSALLYSASLGYVSTNTVAVDASGDAFVAGNRTTETGDYHVFVMKVNPSGSALVYDRGIGGSGDESAASVAVDSSGNAYVTGSTNSQDFPTTAGALQPKSPGPPCPPINPQGPPPAQCNHGFVSKLSPDGQLVYSTYLGGSGADNSDAIAVDGAGEAYVAGNTSSSDFPAATPLRAFGGEVGFLAKLNAAGNALLYSTPFGANNATGTVGLALDGAGNAYIAGGNLVAKIAVVPAPKIASAGVVNGASLLPGPLAPGEIISIFGAGLGPVTPATPTADSSGSIGNSAGGTQVLIGVIHAPVLYAQANQVNAVVPFGVAGALASVAVSYQGSSTSAVEVLLAPAAPAIFAADGSGAGPAAILNQDGKLNTPLHPAQQGEIVAIYATGGGQTAPAESDGQVVTGTSRLTLPVEVTIGGLAAEVIYAGGAPSLVAGANQVNARVPATAPTGPSVPVTLTVGGFTSPPTVTVAIRAAPL
jgi:uncharacterized protein (TIGR03437 family)